MTEVSISVGRLEEAAWKKKRPDGLSKSRYGNLDKKRYKVWAWEFLRRNEEFIAACKRVISLSEVEKLEVAKQYHLKNFKPYFEQYKGKSGCPVFTIGSIKSIHNLDGKVDSLKKRKIEIQQGEVLIRFDIRLANEDGQGLKKQLRLAEKKLTKQLEAYKVKYPLEVHDHSPDFNILGIYLRILDLSVKKMGSSEMFDILCPEHAALSSHDYRKIETTRISARIAKLKKAAFVYANNNYKYLALWTGWPKLSGPIRLEIDLSTPPE